MPHPSLASSRLAARPADPRRGGAVVVYAVLILVVLLLMSTLAVDWGRAQVTKTELQAAADASARYGVNGLKQGPSSAVSQAQYAASLNTADGKAVTIGNADVEVGTWDPESRTFEPLSANLQRSATAVRVTARRTRAKSNAMPLTFGTAVGIKSTDVTAVAIATRGQVVTESINPKWTPWLAGMPAGSRVTGYDGNTTDCVAPTNSPPAVSSIPIVPGGSLYFRQTSGTTSYSNASSYGPDGQTDWIVRQRAANGINPTSAPLNCLVGIFLDDRAPNTYAAAAELDYTTPASRNKATYTPGLKQVFFIGDGLDSSGQLQQFVVPAGATRFYLALMDEKGWWWDNTGQLQTTMLDDTITLVK